LMAAAGEDQGDVLLARLTEDLESVERNLTEGLDGVDVTAIRAQTHILLSLSGAVGALPTQEAARYLNQLARKGDAEATLAAGKVCLGRLAALREELGRMVGRG
ncbi:MAG: Hpt domain-containing protein, partial [Jannaschia sp.]